jgi:hypothetical protein
MICLHFLGPTTKVRAVRRISAVGPTRHVHGIKITLTGITCSLACWHTIKATTDAAVKHTTARDCGSQPSACIIDSEEYALTYYGEKVAYRSHPRHRGKNVRPSRVCFTQNKIHWRKWRKMSFQQSVAVASGGRSSADQQPSPSDQYQEENDVQMYGIL